jgi:hypothetical protein
LDEEALLLALLAPLKELRKKEIRVESLGPRRQEEEEEVEWWIEKDEVDEGKERCWWIRG